ncbi:hypothetical protein U3516DRAFT_732971 [Neocallimastix sp. 'constans']
MSEYINRLKKLQRYQRKKNNCELFSYISKDDTRSNTKNLQADNQEFMTKLLHEIHVNDLLSSEVNILPDYIYDINKFISNIEDISGNFMKPFNNVIFY